MKYKNIKSMAHNFVHSFVSFMNYLDGAYILDDISKQLTKGNMKVTFYPEVIVDTKNSAKERTGFIQRILFKRSSSFDRIKKSANIYAKSLPKHSHSHNVDISKLSSFEVKFEKDKINNILAHVKVIDDRNKLHEVFVPVSS